MWLIDSEKVVERLRSMQAERENRAKMRQYRQFQAGYPKLRRTGKRDREWRGAERQRRGRG